MKQTIWSVEKLIMPKIGACIVYYNDYDEVCAWYSDPATTPLPRTLLCTSWPDNGSQAAAATTGLASSATAA